MPGLALSDEVLRDILTTCLAVPPEVFFRFPTQTPRNSKTSRNSQILLVSKKWLHIGRPLLYSSVKLSTTSQTKSLSIVLKDNPRLGSAVRSLRMEGGYCKELLAIVDLASNINSIYIDLEVLSSDSIVGLRKALPILQPTNVYLHQVNLYGLRKQNRNIEDLRELVESTLTKRWTTLVSEYILPHSTDTQQRSRRRNMYT